MVDPSSFGPMLKAYRKMRGLTQEQLAEKVHYSVETIKKMEADKHRPSKELVERLADSLGLGVEERAAFLEAARGKLAPSLQPPTPLPQPRGHTGRTPIIVVLVVAAIVIISAFIGAFTGTFTGVIPVASTVQTLEPLLKIEFNYSDEPTNHGWRLLNSTPITLTLGNDGYQGSYLIVQSDSGNAIDIDVLNTAAKGTALKFVVKYGATQAPLYVKVMLKSQHGNESRWGWIKVYSGTTSPKKNSEQEWTIYRVPESVEGDWKVFQIDLREAVRSTFGDEGWQHDRIIGFRVRGPMSLAYIAVYE